MKEKNQFCTSILKISVSRSLSFRSLSVAAVSRCLSVALSLSLHGQYLDKEKSKKKEKIRERRIGNEARVDAVGGPRAAADGEGAVAAVAATAISATVVVVVGDGRGGGSGRRWVGCSEVAPRGAGRCGRGARRGGRGGGRPRRRRGGRRGAGLFLLRTGGGAPGGQGVGLRDGADPAVTHPRGALLSGPLLSPRRLGSPPASFPPGCLLRVGARRRDP